MEAREAIQKIKTGESPKEVTLLLLEISRADLQAGKLRKLWWMMTARNVRRLNRKKVENEALRRLETAETEKEKQELWDILRELDQLYGLDRAVELKRPK